MMYLKKFPKFGKINFGTFKVHYIVPVLLLYWERTALLLPCLVDFKYFPHTSQHSSSIVLEKCRCGSEETLCHPLMLHLFNPNNPLNQGRATLFGLRATAAHFSKKYF